MKGILYCTPPSMPLGNPCIRPEGSATLTSQLTCAETNHGAKKDLTPTLSASYSSRHLAKGTISQGRGTYFGLGAGEDWYLLLEGSGPRWAPEISRGVGRKVRGGGAVNSSDLAPLRHAEHHNIESLHSFASRRQNILRRLHRRIGLSDHIREV